MTETVFSCHRRDETLFHSQEDQHTAKEEKLFDDMAIKTSKGKLRMFPNSFQPKLIAVPRLTLPASSFPGICYPVSLELLPCLLGMETVSDSEGEWEGKWCWQEGGSVFSIKSHKEVLTWSHMCGSDGTCPWQHVI